MNEIKLPAKLFAKKISKDGTVTDYGMVSDRAVTTVGVNFIVDAFQGTADLTTLKFHDSGTGTTAENVADTSLVTATGIARTSGTTVEGASANIYRTVGTITYDGTYAITEHGVFSASTNGTLLDRSVFSAINVEDTDTIEFTYELTFPAGG